MTIKELTLQEVRNISQAHSQTQDVNIYNIKAKDGTFFQIVDTPGYNDTKGIILDNLDMFENLIHN